MNEDFRTLMAKYWGKTITAEEMKRLAYLLELPEYQWQLAAMIDESFMKGEAIMEGVPDSEGIFEKICEINALSQSAKVVPFFGKKTVLRWIAVASVILIAFTVLLLTRQSKTGEDQIVQTNVPDIEPPHTNRATVTLTNGQKIYLDSVSAGTVTMQGNAKMLKTSDSQLVYQATRQASQTVEYNILTNPRGSKVINLTLADGTKVWLNAESSLRFPAAFPGNERKVEITGEAYFEVSRDAAKPFIVNKGDMDVQVLGTHFNINSYADEPVAKITLLEGRVQVKKSGNYVYLKPGQQASVQPFARDIRTTDDVDLDEVVAWKNGRFLFNSADLETIMRQVARWYDVDVVYENKTDRTFSGALPRSKNVSVLLKILEATGSVNFEIKGKQIIVKPYH